MFLYIVAAYLYKLARIFCMMKKIKKKKPLTLIIISTIHLHEGEYKVIIYMCKYG